MTALRNSVLRLAFYRGSWHHAPHHNINHAGCFEPIGNPLLLCALLCEVLPLATEMRLSLLDGSEELGLPFGTVSFHPPSPIRPGALALRQDLRRAWVTPPRKRLVRSRDDRIGSHPPGRITASGTKAIAPIATSGSSTTRAASSPSATIEQSARAVCLHVLAMVLFVLCEPLP